MKMKHMAAAAVCGLMAMGGVFGASAAGIGYVNTSVLMQAHPKMERAQLDMNTAAQKARAEFDSKAEGKSDAEKEKIAKAKQYKHMTFYEAAELAKRADVAEMWLTHFSPSLVRGEDYMPQVKKIFSNAYLGKDGKSVELLFEED